MLSPLTRLIPLTRIAALTRIAPRTMVDRWAVRTHEQACVNARGAATAASRRGLERADVEQYLAGRTAAAAVVAHG